MKCPNCGSAITADARFCGECGQALRQLGKSLVEETKPVTASSSPGPDLSGLRTIDDMDTKSPRADSTRVLKPGDVFAGRYEVSSVIGEGGMGVVYRAMDKLTQKEIALKLIRADRLAGKDAVQRLIREGVTSRDIRHPNVVAVYDVGEADGQPYMSMEYLGGQSLRAWTRQRLQTNTDCSMMTAANIVAEILVGPGSGAQGRRGSPRSQARERDADGRAGRHGRQAQDPRLRRGAGGGRRRHRRDEPWHARLHGAGADHGAGCSPAVGRSLFAVGDVLRIAGRRAAAGPLATAERRAQRRAGGGRQADRARAVERAAGAPAERGRVWQGAGRSR